MQQVRQERKREMTLDEWMTARDMPDGTLAASLGVSREYARLLRAGRRNPSPNIMGAIKAITHGAVSEQDIDTAIANRKQKEKSRGISAMDAIPDL